MDRDTAKCEALNIAVEQLEELVDEPIERLACFSWSERVRVLAEIVWIIHDMHARIDDLEIPF